MSPCERVPLTQLRPMARACATVLLWAIAVIALGACSSKTGSTQAASMTASDRQTDGGATRARAALTPFSRPAFTGRLRLPAWSISTTTRRPACWHHSQAPYRACSCRSALRSRPELRLPLWTRPTLRRRSALIARRCRQPRRVVDSPTWTRICSNTTACRSARQAQAETDAVSAEADRDAALQELVSLKVAPQTIKDIQDGRQVTHTEATIRSPIAGTVVERLITPGQLLEAGTTPCFTVADLSRVWVLAQLFGTDLSAVSTGDTAQVATGIGSNSLSGKVDNISALVDPNTRSVQVRVVVDNPGNLLKKQMYVRVLIQARQESTGLLIPVSAVLRDDENLPFVYVAQTDGSFARRHITVGYRAGDRYDISAGVQAGDQIVVAGGIFVQFMQSQ